MKAYVLNVSQTMHRFQTDLIPGCLSLYLDKDTLFLIQIPKISL